MNRYNTYTAEHDNIYTKNRIYRLRRYETYK